MAAGAGRAALEQADPDLEIRTFAPAGQRTLTQLLGAWRSAQRDWDAALTASDAAAAASRVAGAWVAYQDAVGAFPGQMLLVVGDDGRCLAANQHAHELLGSELSDATSPCTPDDASWDNLTVSSDGWRVLLETGQANGALILRTRNGRRHVVEFEAHARSPIAPLHIWILQPRSANAL